MTDGLNLDPNLSRPDDFYDALLKAHQDLSGDQSRDFNARLILILANHIGDLGVLEQALDAARAVSPDAARAV
ncbi:MAG: DUF2783 domain-containing protein [Rhodospirillales bacterium]|nr:DUF2783 domain-containing protein [Rhodospirillales bacterium]